MTTPSDIMALFLGAAVCGLAAVQPAVAGGVVPFSSEQWGVVCEGIKGAPCAVVCRARMDGNTLAVEVELPATAAVPREHTQSLLKQSGVAVFLDPFRNGYGSLILTLSFAGQARLDFFNAADYCRPCPAEVKYKTEKKGDNLLLQASIPLETLQIRPGRGDEWGMALIAYLFDAAGKPASHWTAGTGANMWSLGFSLPYPYSFATMTMGDSETFRSITRGNLAPSEDFAVNRFAWTWLKPADAGRGAVSVSALDESGRLLRVTTNRFDYAAGEPAAVSVAYQCPAEARAVGFEVRDAAGNVIYVSRYPVIGDMPNRLKAERYPGSTAALEKGARDQRLGDIAQIAWGHEWRKEIRNGNAKDMAYEYDFNAIVRWYRESGQAIILVYPNQWGPDSSENIKRLQDARAAGVAVAFQPTAAAVRKEIPLPAGHEHKMFIRDPRMKAAYLDALRWGLTNYGDIIRFVYTGDEFEEGLVWTTLYLWHEKRDEYPLIKEVNEEIKTKYGFGKYGIPEKSNRTFQFEFLEPYHWLALRRWASDVTVAFAKEVIAEARKVKPDVMIFAPDPKAGVRPQYFESWRGLFDIATHQTYLKPTPGEIPQHGLAVKLLRDLSGVPHVWPCLHSEALGAWYSPDEIRGILSDIFAAGADGVHQFTVTARQSPVSMPRENAPGLYAMQMQFLDLARAGQRLRQTDKKEIAVLFANDTCAAHADEYGLPQPARLYQYLTDGCGVSFRFVGDLQLERGDDQLAEYGALVIPVAGILRSNVTAQIQTAVERGLKLVVLDPDAFSYHLDGTDTSGRAQALRGGAMLTKRSPNPSTPLQPDKSAALLKDLTTNSLPVMGDDFVYVFTDLSHYRQMYTLDKLPEKAEVLLRYPDGGVAAVRVAVGKGSVIWLGCNPLNGYYDRSWAEFLRAVFRDMGFALDQPVWRLSLPLEFRPQDREWVHLTGNSFMPECAVPQMCRNVYLPGSYTYSVLPDAVKDVRSDQQPIPFTEGRLTDRRWNTNTGPRHVTYGTNAAMTVTFDLGAASRAERVDVYVADYQPRLALSSSADDANYQSVAAVEGGAEVSGVKCVSLANPKPTDRRRYWRIEFGARPDKRKLTLVEVDILRREP